MVKIHCYVYRGIRKHFLRFRIDDHFYLSGLGSRRYLESCWNNSLLLRTFTISYNASPCGVLWLWEVASSISRSLQYIMCTKNAPFSTTHSTRAKTGITNIPKFNPLRTIGKKKKETDHDFLYQNGILQLKASH